jgi:hypothetical protein
MSLLKAYLALLFLTSSLYAHAQSSLLNIQKRREVVRLLSESQSGFLLVDSVECSDPRCATVNIYAKSSWWANGFTSPDLYVGDVFGQSIGDLAEAYKLGFESARVICVQAPEDPKVYTEFKDAYDLLNR